MSYWAYPPFSWFYSQPPGAAFPVSTDLPATATARAALLPSTQDLEAPPIISPNARAISDGIQAVINLEREQHDAFYERAYVNLMAHVMGLRNLVAVFVLFGLWLGAWPENPLVLFGLITSIVVASIGVMLASAPYNLQVTREAAAYLQDLLAALGLPRITPANEREVYEGLNFLKDPRWIIYVSTLLGVFSAASQAVLTAVNPAFSLRPQSPLMVLMDAGIGVGYLPPSITRAARTWRAIRDSFSELNNFFWDAIACKWGEAGPHLAKFLYDTFLYMVNTAVCFNYSYNIGMLIAPLFLGADYFQSLTPWERFAWANFFGHPFAMAQIGSILGERANAQRQTGPRISRSNTAWSAVVAALGTTLPPAVLLYASLARNGMASDLAGQLLCAGVAALSLGSLEARMPPVRRILQRTRVEIMRDLIWSSAAGTVEFQRDVVLLTKTLTACEELHRSLADIQARRTKFLKVPHITETTIANVEKDAADAWDDVKKCFINLLRAAAIRLVYANPDFDATKKRALRRTISADITTQAHPLYDAVEYLFNSGRPMAATIAILRSILEPPSPEPTGLALTFAQRATADVNSGAGAMPEHPYPPPVPEELS